MRHGNVRRIHNHRERARKRERERHNEREIKSGARDISVRMPAFDTLSDLPVNKQKKEHNAIMKDG